MDRQEVLGAIEREKLIAIVRGVGPEAIRPAAEALYAGGIRLMEMTYAQRNPKSWPVTARMIASLREAFEGRMHIGAGTVTTPELARLSAQAGAEYIISPHTDPEVIRRTRELGLVSIPGAMTATEIVTADRAGADFVKVFPAGTLGEAYIKALRGPLAHIKLLAVGGVDERNAARFLAAGAVGVGVGGNLVDRAWIAAGEYEKITHTARLLTAAVRGEEA